jgi:hypothetical protein
VSQKSLERGWNIAKRDRQQSGDESVPDEGHQPPWLTSGVGLDAMEALMPEARDWRR